MPMTSLNSIEQRPQWLPSNDNESALCQTDESRCVLAFASMKLACGKYTLLITKTGIGLNLNECVKCRFLCSFGFATMKSKWFVLIVFKCIQYTVLK